MDLRQFLSNDSSQKHKRKKFAVGKELCEIIKRESLGVQLLYIGAKPGFEISVDMTDISRIYHMSVKVDTIYPIDGSININFGHFSEFSAIYRRYIGILPIYQ